MMLPAGSPTTTRTNTSFTRTLKVGAVSCVVTSAVFASLDLPGLALFGLDCAAPSGACDTAAGDPVGGGLPLDEEAEYGIVTAPFLAAICDPSPSRTTKRTMYVPGLMSKLDFTVSPVRSR